MPQSSNKIKTSLYLDRDLFAKLKAISERTLIPTSRLPRRAIGVVIEEYKKK